MMGVLKLAYILFLLISATADCNAMSNETTDVVWEQMVGTAWLDYVHTVNRDKQLYGMVVEPLRLNQILGEQIYVKQSALNYQVEMWLWDLSIHGLSGIVLKDLVLERGPELTDLKTVAVLTVDHLAVLGRYRMQGTASSWTSWIASNISSEGNQSLSINMTSAEIRCELVLETVSGCDDPENLVVKSIEFPLDYGDIEFQFDNIGLVLSTVVDHLAKNIVENQKEVLVQLIRDGIKAEVRSLICEEVEGESLMRGRQVYAWQQDRDWADALRSWIGDHGTWLGSYELNRDLLAEELIKKIFKDSLEPHLRDPEHLIQKSLDPLILFPLEFDFRKDVFRAHVEACNVYLHNLKNLVLHNMMLARDKDLTFSALKVEFKIPIVWMSGYYKMSRAKLFGFIPAGGSGDFNVDLKDVTVKLIVTLRAVNNTISQTINGTSVNVTSTDLEMENFKIDATWGNIGFKFDGLWKGFNEIADKVMNQLGVGGVIVRKQKELIVAEARKYLQGLAECIMWKPAQGMELCMRNFWIVLGWEYPWVYPTCQ